MEHGNAPAAGQQLAACPFCGGSAGVRGDFGLQQLGCADEACAGAYLPLPAHDTVHRARAVAAWNRRATLPAAAACVEPTAWLHEFTDPHTGERRSEARKNKPRDYEMLPGEIVTPLYASLPPPARNGEMLDEDEQWAVDRGADLLEQYAGYIREVKPDDIERHPYLPELEQVASELRALSASCAPKQTDKESGK